MHCTLLTKVVPLIAMSVQKAHAVCDDTRKTLLRTRRDRSRAIICHRYGQQVHPHPKQLERTTWFVNEPVFNQIWCYLFWLMTKFSYKRRLLVNYSYRGGNKECNCLNTTIFLMRVMEILAKTNCFSHPPIKRRERVPIDFRPIIGSHRNLVEHCH